ncbi:MAG: hypothetical protein ACREIA_19905 [Opitutaceae bacterium]
METIRLQAGALRALFQPGDGMIRAVRAGPRELLRGIVAPVRDHNWDTVAPVIENLKIEREAGRTGVTFRAVCRNDALDFRWDGAIELSAAGELRYAFHGRAETALRKNRIGFCVLHPPSCAGKPCRRLYRVSGYLAGRGLELYARGKRRAGSGVEQQAVARRRPGSARAPGRTIAHALEAQRRARLLWRRKQIRSRSVGRELLRA